MISRSLALILLSSSATFAESSPVWPQFRGPEGRSLAEKQHPPVDLSQEKHLLWKSDLPAGSSSPVITGHLIFVTGFSEGQLITAGFNRITGALAWRHSFKPEAIEPYFEKLGSPAASSCATDGARVVAYFGSHGLICFDLTGKILWENKMPLVETKDGFGTGTSPIIHHGIIYLLRDEDGPGRGLYAFEVTTGKQIWKQPRKDFRVSFGTPMIWGDSVVVLGDTRVKGYDLKSGEERWVVRGLAAYPCTTPTAAEDGNLYVATWSPGTASEPMPAFDSLLKGMDKDGDGRISFAETEGTGFRDFFKIQDKNRNGYVERDEWEGGLEWMRKGKNVVLAIKPGGTGDITDTHVLWSSEKGAPYVASPLVVNNHVFIVKDGGLATLFEAATGKVCYEKQRLGVAGDYYASPTFAGGRIFCAAVNGTILELDATATEAPKILNQMALGEPLSATPAFVENKVYIRTKEHLWAFGVK